MISASTMCAAFFPRSKRRERGGLRRHRRGLRCGGVPAASLRVRWLSRRRSGNLPDPPRAAEPEPPPPEPEPRFPRQLEPGEPPREPRLARQLDRQRLLILVSIPDVSRGNESRQAVQTCAFCSAGSVPFAARGDKTRRATNELRGRDAGGGLRGVRHVCVCQNTSTEKTLCVHPQK